MTVAALLYLLLPPTGRGAIANVTVNNSPTGFVPASTNIHSGDTVKWTWPSGSSSHNVVSTSAPQQWIASSIMSGPATFNNTFNTPGTFPYKCSVHGFTGQIIVVTNLLSPSVSITNLLPGSFFAAPANVTIQATASDPNNGGTITNVLFLIGSTVLGNQTNPPFFVVTNGLGSGSYALSAVASDNFGLKATNSVSVVVDDRPILAITNPISGAVFAEPANVTIQASAVDDDGTVTNVQFLIGSIILTNNAGSPFFASTNNLSAGSYILSAVATDNAGLKATNSVMINVVTPAPLVLGGSVQFSSTNFQFNYPANAGLNYVIQKSSDLTSNNWVSILTNMADSDSITFVDTNISVDPKFYRVVRRSNP